MVVWDTTFYIYIPSKSPFEKGDLFSLSLSEWFLLRCTTSHDFWQEIGCGANVTFDSKENLGRLENLEKLGNLVLNSLNSLEFPKFIKLSISLLNQK